MPCSPHLGVTVTLPCIENINRAKAPRRDSVGTRKMSRFLHFVLYSYSTVHHVWLQYCVDTGLLIIYGYCLPSCMVTVHPSCVATAPPLMYGYITVHHVWLQPIHHVWILYGPSCLGTSPSIMCGSSSTVHSESESESYDLFSHSNYRYSA